MPCLTLINFIIMAQLQLTVPEAANNLFAAFTDFIQCLIRDNTTATTIEERRSALKADKGHEQQLMTLEETAKALGVTKYYLYKMMSRKQIPYYKPRGKKAYFKRSEVEQVALTNRVATMAESTQAAAAYLIGKEVKG